MDRDCVVEFALRRCIQSHHHQKRSDTKRDNLYVLLLTAHFDRDAETLKQFVATHADNMNAYDAFFWPNHHHLEQRWFLVLRGDHGEVECAERRLI